VILVDCAALKCTEHYSKGYVTRSEINSFLFVLVPNVVDVLESSIRAAPGFIIMIDSQSVQVFEWLVVSNKSSVLGWLRA